jgi:protein NrfD
MSDTFFTGAPHWAWLIILYFFVGGLAGGAYFLAAALEWFGKPEDRPVIRTGYYVAAGGAILSGVLLTIDLDKPLRFWHMLFQSENFPAIMFKAWSPISFGAWAILLFGMFSVLSALGAMSEEGRLRNPALRAVGGAMQGRGLAKLVSGVGGLIGIFVAGYTGILLSVTNRPIWADSPWLGALFLASGASTGAATLILLAPGRGATERSLHWLTGFDSRVLVVELLILGLFLGSLGSVNRVWVSFWGLLLIVGVVGAGILVPLGLHVKPTSFGRLAARPVVNSARLVLVGGFLLRVATLLGSEGIERYRVAAGM